MFDKRRGLETLILRCKQKCLSSRTIVIELSKSANCSSSRVNRQINELQVNKPPFELQSNRSIDSWANYSLIKCDDVFLLSMRPRQSESQIVSFTSAVDEIANGQGIAGHPIDEILSALDEFIVQEAIVR